MKRKNRVVNRTQKKHETAKPHRRCFSFGKPFRLNHLQAFFRKKTSPGSVKRAGDAVLNERGKFEGFAQSFAVRPTFSAATP